MVPGFLRYFTRAKPAEGQPWAALALARAGVARPWPWPGLGVAQPWPTLALVRAGQGQPWPWPGLGVRFPCRVQVFPVCKLASHPHSQNHTQHSLSTHQPNTRTQPFPKLAYSSNLNFPPIKLTGVKGAREGRAVPGP